MTRINLLPPEELTGKHLLAEHREIKRIPNAVKAGRYNLKGAPSSYVMGTGHVKFFYDKLHFLHKRYIELYGECKKRGYNVTCFNDAFIGVPVELYNDWTPTKKEIHINKERIQQRLKEVKQ